jgi:hypothetical protein
MPPSFIKICYFNFRGTPISYNVHNNNLESKGKCPSGFFVKLTLQKMAKRRCVIEAGRTSLRHTLNSGTDVMIFNIVSQKLEEKMGDFDYLGAYNYHKMFSRKPPIFCTGKRQKWIKILIIKLTQGESCYTLVSPKWFYVDAVLPWRRGLVVYVVSACGAMGREIESCMGIGPPLGPNFIPRGKLHS